ncbi:MAG: hypothetical protein N5P05_000373 [Chroococcopsis gigantea SAG 12.99]|jgi:hypothetical protein|nr:PEP-CTERM sorting domain-containing protein [Chlorogloea purpurea SAG 13.99]MDV2998767.1 hypothetical protein [Chroococcopsis gigantea SAG 12.99]
MKNLQFLYAGAISLAALPLVGGNALAATLAIDNFDSGSVDVAITLAAPPTKTTSGSVSADPGDIINNVNRNYTLSKIKGGTGFARASALTIDGPSGTTLTIGNGTGANSNTTLEYKNINADVSAYNLFEFKIVAYDLPSGGAVTIAITAEDTLGNLKTVALPVLAAAPPTYFLPFNFTSFTGVDFSTLKNIKAVISGPDEYDIELDSFGFFTTRSGVPEPATMLGAAIAMGVGFLTTKKGNKKTRK